MTGSPGRRRTAGAARERRLRVYVDTSVFGGCLDPEYATQSQRFFELVRSGRVIALVSQVVVDELSEAPTEVRRVFESLPTASVSPVELTPDIIALRDAYLAAGILAPRWMDDATHVAAATVARADAIVSWNFKHIVRVDKMRLYNQVNLLAGFGLLSIVSPQEVRFDEEEQR
jgi:predicted nucleic acid-binding protein